MGEKIYPNACVPISAIIQYYKDKVSISFEIDITKDDYLCKCSFETPIYEDKETFETIGGFDGFDIRLDDMIQNDDTVVFLCNRLT